MAIDQPVSRNELMRGMAAFASDMMSLHYRTEHEQRIGTGLPVAAALYLENPTDICSDAKEDKCQKTDWIILVSWSQN
jgi:hypothetical protein